MFQDVVLCMFIYTLSGTSKSTCHSTKILVLLRIPIISYNYA